MIESERNRHGWFTDIRSKLGRIHHRRIGKRIERVRTSPQELVEFVASAPLEQEERDRSRAVWQSWADQFFTLVTERRGNKRGSREILDHVASQFSPRRYAVMIEMLGVYTEGSERALWLSDFAKPFLDVHRNDQSVQQEFLLWLGVSSIPSVIKDGMMRELQMAYESVTATPSYTIFSDPQARPVRTDSQTGGRDGISLEHR